MKILVIGSGGREHALVWKISQSKLVDKIFCAPGNGGIYQQAECIDIKAEDIRGLLDFALRQEIDLTVVGPEVPLAGGIVDEFNNYRLKIFGPNKKAARLEASKIFAKELMAKYSVPTADFKVFDEASSAKKYIEARGAPCVVKADGLASGKGVMVAKTIDEAKEAVDSILERKIFGGAGSRIIIEDCLEGQEASILVLTDSKEILPLASSQDHKRVFDNDTGPNTGGMGAYSPAPVVTDELFSEILDKIIRRTIGGLVKEGVDYRGILYAGVMITKQGPKVLEFNVRFGDPETQAILPRLNSDLLELMLAVSEGNLSKALKTGGCIWDKRSSVCVVLAQAGYPGEYETGKEITGLEEASMMKDVLIFQAATKRSYVASPKPQVQYFTTGGRVLGVTGLGNGVREAIDTAYGAVGKIYFEGMHYRKDIGRKAL